MSSFAQRKHSLCLSYFNAFNYASTVVQLDIGLFIKGDPPKIFGIFGLSSWHQTTRR